MPIGTGIIYNVGDLILSQVSGSGTAFLETKIAAATSSIVYFDSTARINSASLNSITVGTASYVSGSTSIITNLTASNISASGTGSFGMVGIGTTSPTKKLDVNGDAVFGSAATRLTTYSDSGYSGIFNGASLVSAESIYMGAGALFFIGGGIERMRIDSTGNVGIGTTSPAGKLHISGSGQTIMRLDSDTTTNVSQFQIKAASDAVLIMGMLGGSAASTNFGVTAAGQAYFGTSTLGSPHPTSLVIGNVSNIPIAFSTNNVERMRIDSGGAVGIGTTTVSRTLHTYVTTGPVMRLQSSGSNASIEFIPSIGHNRYNWLIGAQQNISDAFEITPSTATNGTTFSTPAVLVASSGNVGIGTTSPTQRLDLSGSLRIRSAGTYSDPADNAGFINYDSTGGIFTLSARSNGGNTYMAFRTSNAGTAGEKMRIINDGNVGIGTTSPGALLDVSYGDYQSAGTVRIGADLGANTSRTNVSRKWGLITGYNYTNASAAIPIIGYDSANTYTAINIGGGTSSIPASPTYISFFTTSSLSTYGAERVRIISDGNVGIGTASPADKLHVIGNIRINGGDILNWGGQAFIQTIGANDMFFRPNSTLRMILTAAGNLGLGNGFTSPAYLLDVSGSSRHGYQTTDTHQFTGSVSVSGSLNATASWATNALTASSLVAANSYTITNLTASNISASLTGSFGYVGIGTASPAAKLDVSANAVDIAIFRSSGGLANDKRLTITSGGEKVIFNVSDNSNTAIARAYEFQNAGTASMTLNTSGNLGIGTTNPGAKLQVAGNVSGSSFTSSISNAVGFLGTSSWAQNVVSASFATTAQTANALNTGNSYTISGLTVNGNISASGTISASKLRVVGTANVIELVQASTGSATYYVMDNTVETGGRRYRFGYSGASADLGSFTIYNQTDNITPLTITTSGSVGIGTTGPSTPLHVFNTTATLATFTRDLATDVGFSIGADSNGTVFSTAGAHAYQFYTNGTEKVRISSDGNVGIGTSSPAQKLEVQSGSVLIRGDGTALFGTYYASAGENTFFTLHSGSGNTFHIGNDVSGTNYTTMVFTAATDSTGGKVGIGTTNPVAKLQVAGNISGSSFTSSISNAVGFLGTSSWAQNVVSASFATTAQTANALNTGNSYTVGSLTSTTQIGGTTGTIQSLVTPGIYSNGLGTGNAIAISSNTTFANQGAWANLGLHQTTANANDLTAKVYLAIGGWYQNSGTGLPVYIGGGYTSNSSSVLSVVPSDTAGTGNVGIGTTAPAAKLEISGSSNSVLMNIKSPISGAILYVSGSGAVGIGTSNVGAYTLQVNGSFAATTKSFVIEHPTKAGKKLIYGSLESPYHGIRLTGRDTLVNGKCKIQLPDYIYKLILHDSVNIQLTGIKCNKTLYVDEINIPENYFTIAYDKAIFESYKDYDFFWDFTGIRTDVPELITEL